MDADPNLLAIECTRFDVILDVGEQRRAHWKIDGRSRFRSRGSVRRKPLASSTNRARCCDCSPAGCDLRRRAGTHRRVDFHFVADLDALPRRFAASTLSKSARGT